MIGKLITWLAKFAVDVLARRQMEGRMDAIKLDAQKRNSNLLEHIADQERQKLSLARTNANLRGQITKLRKRLEAK